MLNLLIGILSEKLGDIMSNKTISSYRLLLDICIKNETLSNLFTCYRAEEPREHLAFATLRTSEEKWEGAVQATKDVMEKESLGITG